MPETINSHNQILNIIADVKFDHNDILDLFKKYQSPLEAFIAIKKYSLSYIVKTVFRNEHGEPLELLPFQSALLWMLWTHKYPMVLASRGAGKTFMYALYAVLRAILVPGSKICIVGAGFRQAKLVFEYIEKFCQVSPLLHEAIKADGGPKRAVDQCALKIGASNIFAIPLGDGSRIRGFRANVILADEFASINEEIFERVIQPFAAVRADPVKSVKIVKVINLLKKYNAPKEIIELVDEHLGFGNQICISGTAFYEFNHFYRKYEMFRKLIFSGGDRKVITQAFTEGNKYLMQGGLDQELLKSFRHTDYAIFQLPWVGIPAGFMDETVIINAKLTDAPSKFGMEYLCRFAKDSDGFFKRSLIEGARPREQEYRINIELFGQEGAQYVMAIDPARYNDNLAIVILKLTQKGYEFVYSWAMRGKSFDIAVRKIRELISRFNIVLIAMDQGGGGSAIADLLCSSKFLEKGEQPIWNINDDANKNLPGLHILDMFQWSNEWIREANYAMKAEIHNKTLLFPSEVDEEMIRNQYCKFFRKKSAQFNEQDKLYIFEELYGQTDKDDTKIIDGVWDNIEETINETCAIVVKVTEAGAETFILPPLSIQNKNQSLTDARRRDRYSALLLAAYAARKLRGTGHKPRDIGGNTDYHYRLQGKSGTGVRRGGDGSTCWPVFD